MNGGSGSTAMVTQDDVLKLIRRAGKGEKVDLRPVFQYLLHLAQRANQMPSLKGKILERLEALDAVWEAQELQRRQLILEFTRGLTDGDTKSSEAV